MPGYFMPPVSLIGAGVVEEIGEQIRKQKGTKVLVVTDKILIELGIVEEVVKHIEAEGIEMVIFDDVQPNPTVKNVEDGLELLNKEDCNLLVSIGGGSVHDCAKGIALIVTNGGNIIDYQGVDQSTKPSMPLIAVNTTAGTASEMTRFSIITDEERSIKMPIIDWRITPNVAINDPLLMLKKPAALTAATGMDALTHAIEAYVSTNANPVTDSVAIKAIELIANSLRKAVSNGDNIEARENMAYAEFLAGMAFNNASIGLVHAMAHQLGGLYDLPHGVCNAVLLPYVEEFNLIANQERLVDIADAMGEKTIGLSTRAAADKAIEAITKLSKDIGIPQRLSQLEGVKKEDFEILAENALKDACIFTNPRRATKEDIIALFEIAY